MERIDPLMILAGHVTTKDGARRCLECENQHGRAVEWPCLPYRLAAQLETVTRTLAVRDDEMRRWVVQ